MKQSITIIHVLSMKKMKPHNITICRWHDFLNRKPWKLHQKKATRNNYYSKFVGNKINIQKSIVFLYANDEPAERKLKKISFTIVTKRIKYLGINLTKEVKDLYTENLRQWWKNLRKTQIETKWKFFNLTKAPSKIQSWYFKNILYTFLPKVRNKTRISTCSTFIQHRFRSLSHSNQRRKRNKRHSNCKRSKAANVGRWYDTPYRKPQHCYQETNGAAHQWIW